MTRSEAQLVLDELRGWDDPAIVGGEYGEDDYVVEATEPMSQRRMRYNTASGYFEG